MTNPVFVCQRQHKETRVIDIVLTREPVRELLVKYPEYRWEQLQRFNLIQDARLRFPDAEALFTKTYTGLSPAARKRISKAKIGKNNPNYYGIPEERKIRIRATMRARDRRQIRNPFFGRKHKESSKAAIARAARARRFKWAMEPGGQARKVPRNFELPPGWRWGHGGFKVNRRRLGVT